MPKLRRYFRVSITVSHELMETLFDLLKNEDAHDFRMMELGPDGQVPKAQPASPAFTMQGEQRKTRDYSTPNPRSERWVLKYWPKLEPVFRNHGQLNHKDMRIIQAIVDAGMSPSSTSTTLSSLVHYGKLIRVDRGEYKIP